MIPLSLGCDFDLWIVPLAANIGGGGWSDDDTGVLFTGLYKALSCLITSILSTVAKNTIWRKKSDRRPTTAKMQNLWIAGTNVSRPNVRIVT